jgi:hypothetical protein
MNFKFKLQFKFRKNKHYSSIIVAFYTGLHKKYINLQLKFKNNNNWHEKTTQCYIATFLQLLITVTSSRLSKLFYSWCSLYKHANNFRGTWIVEFTRLNFLHLSAVFFHFLFLLTPQFFSSMVITLLLFVSVATLSLYLSPYESRVEK